MYIPKAHTHTNRKKLSRTLVTSSLVPKDGDIGENDFKENVLFMLEEFNFPANNIIMLSC